MARIDLSESACCYSVVDIRAIENHAIDKQGIPGIRLMTQAGRVAFEVIEEWITEPAQMYVFCGGGNNGGDGFVVAGLAADAGWSVSLVDLSDPNKLSDEARQARKFALEKLDSVLTDIPDLGEGCGSEGPGIIVDALLGIGFQGELRGSVLDACVAINQSLLPVFSLDTPSGVNADTGDCAPDAVLALATVSFIAAKRGLLTGAAENCVGELVIDDLGLAGLCDPGVVAPELKPHPILGQGCVEAVFPPRFASAHKGAFGHLLIVGGNDGMSGAAILAAEAALSLGAGKISVATRNATLAPLLSRAPEVMARQVDHYNDLKPLINKCTAIVVGPGLGTDAWAEQMLLSVLQEDIPTVIDADAIRLVVTGVLKPSHDRICYTPHPGEAALVLKSNTAEIQRDRFEALSRLEKAFSGHWLLKGNGTLSTNKRMANNTGPASINRTGNPGMASGGMGDVLSGLIGSILAQGYDVQESMEAGVYIQGAAADIAAGYSGETSLRASEVITAVPELLFSLEQSDLENADG